MGRRGMFAGKRPRLVCSWPIGLLRPYCPKDRLCFRFIDFAGHPRGHADSNEPELPLGIVRQHNGFGAKLRVLHAHERAFGNPKSKATKCATAHDLRRSFGTRRAARHAGGSTANDAAREHSDDNSLLLHPKRRYSGRCHPRSVRKGAIKYRFECQACRCARKKHSREYRKCLGCIRLNECPLPDSNREPAD